MRVVVVEFMSQEGLATLSQGAEVEYDPTLCERPGALYAAVADAHALVVRNRTRVDAHLLAAAPRLKVIGRLGAGLDNLDLPTLRKAGVEAVYAPGVNAVATAEFTLALAFALARRLRPEWLGGRGADWAERPSCIGIELCGRTMALVGLGRVGQAVARKARALGMRVVAAQPSRSPDDPVVRDLGVELVTMPELLRGGDLISLHCPLTAETRGLIGRRELALVRPGAMLINTARGALIDETALALALREGWLAGAALDVRHPEPPADPDPLDGVPGLIRTPHIAGLTQEAQRLTGTQVARDVLRVLAGPPPRPAPSDEALTVGRR